MLANFSRHRAIATESRLWAPQKWLNRSRYHRRLICAQGTIHVFDRVHMGATWQIWLNNPCSAALGCRYHYYSNLLSIRWNFCTFRYWCRETNVSMLWVRWHMNKNECRPLATVVSALWFLSLFWTDVWATGRMSGLLKTSDTCTQWAFLFWKWIKQMTEESVGDLFTQFYLQNGH